jgi:hypothetical protein
MHYLLFFLYHGFLVFILIVTRMYFYENKFCNSFNHVTKVLFKNKTYIKGRINKLDVELVQERNNVVNKSEILIEARVSLQFDMFNEV